MKTIPLVGCIITDDHGKILVIHRNTPRLHQWELPGGKVEPGETFEQAAQREALEEISAQVTIGNEIGQADFIDNDVNWEYHWFTAGIVNGTAEIGEPDRYDGIQYTDLLHDQLDDILSPNLINLRNAALAGEVELS